MRTLVILVLGLSLLSGCALSDALFGAFGDNYSGGGYTRSDKKDHYDRQIEASRAYEPDFATR
jgi:hypothetical protein